jgi:hypothetical protein
MTGGWVVEMLPHKIYSTADKKRHWRFEWNKPRFIAAGSTLHISVLERLKERREYAPINLGTRDEVKLREKFVIET